LIALDNALNALARFDARKVLVVEWRFSDYLIGEEMAAVVKVSRQSVLRDWKLARTGSSAS
jgi:hypothetical protein